MDLGFRGLEYGSPASDPITTWGQSGKYYEASFLGSLRVSVEPGKDMVIFESKTALTKKRTQAYSPLQITVSPMKNPTPTGILAWAPRDHRDTQGFPVAEFPVPAKGLRSVVRHAQQA